MGRIYDEHGRALLVERGQRVKIDPEGKREIDTFANKDLYPALFREGEWNDYRIVCRGPRVQLYINGFKTVDYQEEDKSIPLKGRIAVQIHSGPPGEAWYRRIQIRRLK